MGNCITCSNHLSSSSTKKKEKDDNDDMKKKIRKIRNINISSIFMQNDIAF